jgi:hypothetical protein
MDAPLAIILDMIRTVFLNTLGTLGSLLGLFGSLMQSLTAISGTGAVGFVVAILVFGAVLFFLGKFFLSSWKLLAVIFVAGFLIIWMLMAGAG